MENVTRLWPTLTPGPERERYEKTREEESFKGSESKWLQATPSNLSSKQTMTPSA